LVVVLGQPTFGDNGLAQEEQDRVGRIVRQIRSWALPVEVVGVWVEEHWEPDAYIESKELECSAPEEIVESDVIGAGALHRGSDHAYDGIAAQQEIVMP
jgi:hypothetical protein